MPSLFDPVALGALIVPNRILMAPLTRTRGSADHVATPIMADYYAQRASAGLIVSEAIGISRQGLGMPHATGLWRDDQVAGWRRVTDAVHAANGRIIAQIWHMGRMVHPSFTDGATPISSSSTRAPGRAHTYDGRAPYAEARPLAREEIVEVVEDYRLAARNALRAGFDGVQVHAANGYLIDQFLRDNANHRDDDYGGGFDNRMRFLLDVTRAVCAEAGADRTSVRLSPNGDTQGVNDSDPEPLFAAVARALDPLGLAFLELREPPRDGTLGMADRDPIAPAIRANFGGKLVLNSDLTREAAERLVADGAADAVSFGRLFISNPDLPERFARDHPLSDYDRATSYAQGPEGYTDYPAAAP
ncbi:alkene reductase [Sphingopyxis lindanitolerans]|uniref:Alkene reductase n=1 Tax=Sphingopyxis lindanitolerans TaxID=2054227 RepID=A0A2S8B1W8_9SPHN|nr:alkene reductase [Sphingopyxis lindanitolerans]PQM26298.1 alkene reductase [Sphingopyxis lindanitolerans]